MTNEEKEMYEFLEALLSIDEFDLGDPVGSDRVGEYTIDTCDTIDQGYETAIQKNEGNWIIVQRYDNREKAETGHKVWCAMCTTNPVKVFSVQTRKYEEF